VVTLVTGATGFIGRYTVDALRLKGVPVRVLTRDARKVTTMWPDKSVTGICANLVGGEKLNLACKDADTILHLAGYAHAADQDSREAKRLQQATTVEGTRALLSAAVGAGVRRFVFLSSVKAMSEGGEDCLDETACETPTTHYGRAKLEAERLVLAAGREHGIHVCVLRLPLVYGLGNKGNIPRMIAAIDQGRFPPMPRIQNRRSMVHVNDVVEALLLAAERPLANGKVYIVTDGHIYSTRKIYTAICQALGHIVPAWTVPAWVLRLAARFGDAIERIPGCTSPLTTSALDKLLGSAWYSSEKIHRELGFVPRYTLFDVLPDMVADYRRKAGNPLSVTS